MQHLFDMHTVSVSDISRLTLMEIRNIFHTNGIGHVTRVDLVDGPKGKGKAQLGTAIVHLDKWYVDRLGFAVYSELSQDKTYRIPFQRATNVPDFLYVKKVASSTAAAEDATDQRPPKKPRSQSDKVVPDKLSSSLENEKNKLENRYAWTETKWPAKATNSNSCSGLLFVDKSEVELLPTHICVEGVAPSGVFVMVHKLMSSMEHENQLIVTRLPGEATIHLNDGTYHFTFIVRVYSDKPKNEKHRRSLTNEHAVIEFESLGGPGDAARFNGWVNTVKQHVQSMSSHIGREDFVNAGVEPSSDYRKISRSVTYKFIPVYKYAPLVSAYATPRDSKKASVQDEDDDEADEDEEEEEEDEEEDGDDDDCFMTSEFGDMGLEDYEEDD